MSSGKPVLRSPAAGGDCPRIGRQAQSCCCSTSPVLGSTMLKKSELVALLKRLKGHGLTILIIDHDMHLVEQVADTHHRAEFRQRHRRWRAGRRAAQSRRDRRLSGGG